MRRGHCIDPVAGLREPRDDAACAEVDAQEHQLLGRGPLSTREAEHLVGQMQAVAGSGPVRSSPADICSLGVNPNTAAVTNDRWGAATTAAPKNRLRTCDRKMIIISLLVAA